MSKSHERPRQCTTGGARGIHCLLSSVRFGSCSRVPYGFGLWIGGRDGHRAPYMDYIIGLTRVLIRIHVQTKRD